MRPEDNESPFFEGYGEDDDASFIPVRPPETKMLTLKIAAAQFSPIRLGEKFTFETKAVPWSIWRFWRKAKPAETKTFIVANIV